MMPASSVFIVQVAWRLDEQLCNGIITCTYLYEYFYAPNGSKWYKGWENTAAKMEYIKRLGELWIMQPEA